MRTANFDDLITFFLKRTFPFEDWICFPLFSIFQDSVKTQIPAVIGSVDKAFASHQGYRGSNQGCEKPL